MRTKYWISVVLLLAVLTSSGIGSLTTAKELAVYLSTKGNDSNSGTKQAPVHSLEKAKEIARSLRHENQGSAIAILVEEGTYQMENPVIFTSEDSGSEENTFVIKALGKAKPVFKGSRPLKDWKQLENPDQLKFLSEEVKGKLYVTNLKDAGTTSFGDPIEPGKRPELFCNGQLQTLARWPNQGFTRAGKVKGLTELPQTYQKVRGTKEGVFGYVDPRQDRWAYEKEACLGGYWYWDWSDQFQKVAKVDAQSRTLYLAEPYHHYGFKDSLRYFGVNLFCEMDQPGEWYLDRSEGLLYWYPPVGVNPATADVALSVFSDPYLIELKNCSHITLQGLSFEESRGSALSITGGEKCLIKDCRMERFGRDGIHINGGSGHGISGCLIRTLGFRGIDIKGGDRKTLTPANDFIEHTVVEHFALFQRTYEPAVYLDGCGIRVSNNRFRHSSSSAMRLEGNDFTIEYNEVSQVVNESDDQGAVDIFFNPSYRGIKINYNYWSDIQGGTHNGAAGVRLDDMISGVTIFGNIFERAGAVIFGGVQIHGGKDNLVENNLFYNCLAAVSFSRWGEKRWLEQLDSPEIKKKILEEVDINSALFQQKYPDLKSIREHADVNTIKNNLIVDCKNQFLRNKQGVQILENNTTLQSEGNNPVAFCAPKLLKKYGLQPIPYEKIGPKNNPWIK